MRAVPAILANLILAVAALGLGGVVERFLPQSFSRLERFTMRLLGGLGLIGTILFDVGQEWFNQRIIITLVLIGAVFGARFLILAARGLRANTLNARISLLAGLIIACVLIVTAVGGLVEPSGNLGQDSIAYHYLGPKVWLRDGAIRPVPDQLQTAFPAIVETSYGALMALGGQRAPNFFAVIGLSALLLVAACLAMRLKTTFWEACWVAALIVAMPAVYGGAASGFIDAMFAAFVLAAARIGFDAKRLRDYAAFGMFCGFAMGTKYTGLIACAALLGCLVLTSALSPNFNWKTLVKGLGVAGGVAAVVAAPCYVRNWILLGSPIYPPPPGLSRVFEVKFLSPDAIEKFHEYILRRGTGMGRGPLSLLLLPFHLTYHTSNFSGAGGIGLAPLALAPFGIVAARRDAFARSVTLLAAVLTLAWFATEQESRFLIHVYAIAAIFAVLGWRYVVRAAPKFGPALSISVVGLSILYGLFMIGRMRTDDLHTMLSSSFAEQRRREAVPFYGGFDYLNSAPSAGRVLVLDPLVPTYYLDRDYVKPVGSFDEQTIPNATDLGSVLSDLHALQISYVLDVHWDRNSVIPDHYDPRRVRMDYQLPENPTGLTLVFEGPDDRVYRVDQP
jgi:hypothetical protein